MATDGELISLMAHTLGSIGQIVKEQALTGKDDDDSTKLAEIERIYEGYIKGIQTMTYQVR